MHSDLQNYKFNLQFKITNQYTLTLFKLRNLYTTYQRLEVIARDKAIT